MTIKRKRARSFAGSPHVKTIAFVSVACLLFLNLPDHFAQSVGAGQSPTNSQRNSGPRDEKYYERLLDATFYNVERVVELGMDFALNYKEKVKKEVFEWITGRSLKTPEDEDYFQAMDTLYHGWELLLKSATIYHQSRERQTDDATTERLRDEARKIYHEGVEKVIEAHRLRKLADEKRSARRRAEEERAQKEREAANERRINDVKALAAQFEQVNEDETKEDDLHNLNIANIESAAAGNPKRRQALLDQEDGRHRRRMAELDQRRDALGKKLIGDGTASHERPDWKDAGDGSERVGPPVLTDAYECFPIPPKVYEGCGATLAKEKTRWESEAAQNKRDIARENARNSHRMEMLSKGKTPGSNPGQETQCHEKNARQLDEESTALQERHRKCVETGP